ncbi:MAG: ABC transporter ATP-binding protein, partial [Anaerolineae bacterium]|nr:ABC transporter ATP-binding protein [Anaerolineae bacterium]
MIAPLLMVLEVAMDLMQPRLMQTIVDDGIGAGDMGIVLHTGALMIVVAFLGAVGGFGCTVFAVRAAVNYGADLRSAMFRKVQTLSFGNLDKLGAGPLITRLTNDVIQIQDVVLIALRILVRAPLMSVGSFIMAITTSPRLSVLFVVFIPLLFVLLAFVVRRTYPLFTYVQTNLDRLNTVVQENLSGARVVKAFVRNAHEIARFGVANDTLTASAIRAMQLGAVVGPFMLLLVNFGIAGVIWFGGIDTAQGNMTVGELIAFINYLRQTLFPLMMVSMLVIRIARAQASAERIIEVLDSEPEIQDRPDALPAIKPRGHVAFEHVTFSYNGGEPVLQDISFEAQPGQTVAILGTTGSGKSSLVQLIPRFYDVDAGRVTLDGVDVRDIRQSVLRANVGIALQESVLFSGTIYDNIKQGRDPISREPAAVGDEEIYVAARAAQAHGFITEMPNGYDTHLGQRGVNLSGGQKQRIA